MSRRPKQTFLQRRHTDGQQTHEKMLNTTHYKRRTNQNYHVSLTVTKYKLDVQIVRIQSSQQWYDQKQTWDIFIEASTICRHESNFVIYMSFKLNTHIWMCLYINKFISVFFAWCKCGGFLAMIQSHSVVIWSQWKPMCYK